LCRAVLWDVANLTLALTAALSADEAFAEHGDAWFPYILGQVEVLEVSTDVYLPDERDALIAIIAIEHGPGVAYEMLSALAGFEFMPGIVSVSGVDFDSGAGTSPAGSQRHTPGCAVVGRDGPVSSGKTSVSDR